MHAYINVQHICTLIRRAGRAGGKSGLCRQKLTQDFSFKIHIFLQKVLQTLVLSTSKSVTSRCFCYFCLSSGDNFATCSAFIGIYFGLSLNKKRS